MISAGSAMAGSAESSGSRSSSGASIPSMTALMPATLARFLTNSPKDEPHLLREGRAIVMMEDDLGQDALPAAAARRRPCRGLYHPARRGARTAPIARTAALSHDQAQRSSFRRGAMWKEFREFAMR